MKLQEVNYRQPLGKLSGTGERLPRGPRAYPKPPKKKKAAPLPRPDAKKSYEGYSKGIDKTIKQIQSALKLRRRARKGVIMMAQIVWHIGDSTRCSEEIDADK